MFNLNLGYQGAGVLIYHVQAKDKVYVLLGKRLNNPDKNLWSIPGGGWEKKDVDESGNADLAETARREMNEETGFYLPKQNKDFLRRLWNMNVIAFKFQVFALRMKRKKFPYKHYEFSMMKWFDVNEIPAEHQCNKFLHAQVNNLKKFLISKGYLSQV